MDNIIESILYNYNIEIENFYIIKDNPYPIIKIVNDRRESLLLKVFEKKINNKEDKFLDHLISKNLCNYEYIINKENTKYTTIDGTKLYFYVRKFIEGDDLNYADTKNAFLYGQTLALIHDESKKYFITQRENRIPYIINTLIDTILSLLVLNYPHKLTDFIKIKEWIRHIELEDKNIDMIYVHGDAHGGNALLLDKKISFIDWEDVRLFDQLYDISCFYWMCSTTGNDILWRQFTNGYYGKEKNITINQKIRLFTLYKDLLVFKFYLTKFYLTYHATIDSYIDNRICFIEKIMNNQDIL